MRLSACLCLAYTASCAVAIKLPAAIALDVVFPGNDTYKNLTQMPVVFALHNADAALRFGYTLDWEISERAPRIRSTGMVDVGLIYKSRSDSEAPQNAVNNIWYPSELTHSNRWTPGAYTLKWKWTMTTCSEKDHTVTYHIGDEVARGSVNFTLADDGSDLDLTKDCPVHQALILVGRESQEICASLDDTAKEEKPDSCNARMSKDMATCIMANLTETDDEGTCSKLVRIDNAGSMIVVSQFGLWTLFVVAGLVLLS
ncbi:hypothetical protein NM208_g14041 [Fusarium decemcellulare]|uniref:Uncharacterized protein n=1 Tax=Fusarium decemcellulare TaxID=57161 RepID=A0ACC1RI64_9HYPO|nr:hypothetical protein NM208_g14041 [Fusarium decemcellulare]